MNKPINTELPSYKLSSKGFDSLSDPDVLSILIGDNKIEKCRCLLQSVSYNLNNLAKLTYSDFQKSGLTRRESNIISSALELGRRRKLADAEELIQVRTSKDVADIFQPLLSDLPHEEFWILFLNRCNRIIGRMKLSQGGLNGTVTDVRLVMKKAVEYLASGIIVCHNHPSGNLNPSESDTKITQKIKQAGDIMDIQLLDHLIIADKEYYSLADNGNL
jgi:DNA repair protein RadC